MHVLAHHPPLQLDAQVARVAKERSEQGPRLAISDRTRAAVVRALLRLGSSVAEAQAKAEQIGAKLGTPIRLDVVCVCGAFALELRESHSL